MHTDVVHAYCKFTQAHIFISLFWGEDIWHLWLEQYHPVLRKVGEGTKCPSDSIPALDWRHSKHGVQDWNDAAG